MLIEKDQVIVDIRVQANAQRGLLSGDTMRIAGWPVTFPELPGVEFVVDMRCSTEPIALEDEDGDALEAYPVRWCVSELSTGFLAGDGESREEAIAMVQRVLQRIGPEKFLASVAKGKAELAEILARKKN